MSQQPDPTIPFDASVVDEEALRALRALQRSHPMGDGGASGNLVGGTEAVAAFGMVKGGLSGGIAVRPHEIAPRETSVVTAPEEETLKTLDLAPPAQSSIILDQARSDADASTFSATATPLKAPRVATAQGASGDRLIEADAPPMREISPAAADEPDDPQVPTPPIAENPEPEEPADIVAAPPFVSSRDVVGLEDTAIGLDLSAALADRDGSETLTVSLLGVPEGAVLSHGTRQADGSWSVPAADLAHLTLTPPQDFSGTLELTLRATARETGTESSTVAETTFRVQVGAVADAPAVTVADARGSEDTPVSLAGLSGALRDRDGSEALGFVLTGVPADATLSAGTRQSDGSWKLTAADLSGLKLTPPAHFSGSYSLTLTAISTESSNGSTARTSAGFTVGIDPVADSATISGASTGAEDAAIVIRPAFALTDRDGSETWSEFTQIKDVPPGAILGGSASMSEVSPGVWQVSTSDLMAGKVTIQPPVNSDADFVLRLTATLTDTGNGTSVSREVTGTQAVTVSAVADAPQVEARHVSGQEDQPIALDLSAALADADGSEHLTVAILGVPDGASLSHGSRQPDGSWSVPAGDLAHVTLTPPHDFSGTIDLIVRATAQESSNGVTATTDVPFQVSVTDVADAPQVEAHNVTGLEDQPIALDLTAALTDTDGSEHLTVSILGVPEGFTLSSGTAQSGGGWLVPAESLHDLKLVPLPDWSGTLNLTIHATSSETGTGGSAMTAKSFTVTIDPVNDAPELTLTSAEHAHAGDHQAETFGTAQAEDIDSAQLGGAVITLSGSQPGDRLDLEGLTLHSENGRMMIGDTGIEVVGGAYVNEAGTLTLSGHASPETYATVLQSLMLESADQSGLAAGTRSIGVVLFDSAGAGSARQSVDVVIDEVELGRGEEQGFAATSSEAMQNGAGSDMILLMADGESAISHSVAGSWTDQIDSGDASTPSDHVMHLDQPTEHVPIIDDLQADAARMSWS